MKAAIFKGKGNIAVEERPKPTISEPTDAIVRVVLACVCGSDLWFYRGKSDLPHGGDRSRVHRRRRRDRRRRDGRRLGRLRHRTVLL